jgi:phosphopantothenoylcysteine decarboxylase/phosphopantothenate--cysteine ligase
LLAVTGSVAAYKSIEILRGLRKEQKNVKVILTKGAEQFINKLSFASLGAEEVFTDDDQFTVDKVGVSIHLSLARWADCILIAPASADAIAKIRAGIADSLLLTTVLVSTKPLFIAPCMNEDMLLNKITSDNIDFLRKNGVIFIETERGELADFKIGKGRLQEPGKIVSFITDYLNYSDRFFEGKNILITAGRTREYIDPVRFITNSSSGKMGISIARVAKAMGAHTEIISGEISTDLPIVDAYKKVETTEEMLTATKEAFKDADILIMAAAPVDFRPETISAKKIPKKKEIALKLLETPDILKELSKEKSNKIIVGFALQTEDLEGNALRKMREKNMDIVVANRESNIGKDSGTVMMFDKYGNKEIVENAKKEIIAEKILLFLKKFIEGGKNGRK